MGYWNYGLLNNDYALENYIGTVIDNYLRC